MGFTARLKHAWDAFRSRDPTRVPYSEYQDGVGYQMNPTHVRLTIANERSIIAAIYNRIAIDVASIDIRHVMVDQNGRFTGMVDDNLNQCLTVSPNLDQTPRAFRQDIALSAMDEGYVAVFISKADLDPVKNGTYDIQELRRGRIIEWYPNHVVLEAYNPNTGNTDRISMPKKSTALIENPLYAVMNAPNSTLQRLIAKLNILDAIDRQSGSGKWDLIIQLPYSSRNEIKKEQAENRKKDIEFQLANSRYGVAYLDASERVTQLNRPVENNLLNQIEYLHNTLYSQLGLSPGVFDGTASEQEMLNYNNRTIEPYVAAITEEMNRKFLTKTARTRGHRIMYFRDPFKLVPSSQMPEFADKFTRNEILSSNEIRAIMGFLPSDDPRADELRNSNISASKDQRDATPIPAVPTDDELPQDT